MTDVFIAEGGSRRNATVRVPTKLGSSTLDEHGRRSAWQVQILFSNSVMVSTVGLLAFSDVLGKRDRIADSYLKRSQPGRILIAPWWCRDHRLPGTSRCPSAPLASSSSCICSSVIVRRRCCCDGSRQAFWMRPHASIQAFIMSMLRLLGGLDLLGERSYLGIDIALAEHHVAHVHGCS